MTDENKIVEEKCDCLCKNKYFRKFIVVAAGTFVGAFFALSLFAALNKPPQPMPMPCPCQQFRPDFSQQHFDRGLRGDFHKIKKHVDKQMPPRMNKDVEQED